MQYSAVGPAVQSRGVFKLEGGGGDCLSSAVRVGGKLRTNYYKNHFFYKWYSSLILKIISRFCDYHFLGSLGFYLCTIFSISPFTASYISESPSVCAVLWTFCPRFSQANFCLKKLLFKLKPLVANFSMYLFVLVPSSLIKNLLIVFGWNLWNFLSVLLSDNLFVCPYVCLPVCLFFLPVCKYVSFFLFRSYKTVCPCSSETTSTKWI